MRYRDKRSSAQYDLGPPEVYRRRADRANGARTLPKTILWVALSLAPDDGITVPDLMDGDRHEPPVDLPPAARTRRQGQVIQVSRGRWRAVTDDAS